MGGSNLCHMLDGPPFVSYVYSYPHKTAHRPLESPRLMRDLWADEDRQHLFLYAHVPFCRFRCGYCNLLSLSKPDPQLVERYLNTLQLQAEQTKEAIFDARFARLALGGGSPTFLSLAELDRLFDILRSVMEADLGPTPFSVEASPANLDARKLAFLREHGVDRLSLGVQSFDDSVCHSLGRRQTRVQTERALDLIGKVDFPLLNVDLIYGAEGESKASFLDSIERALRFEPEEIYLYPLYVRHLTGLGQLDRVWDDQRLDFYRSGRDLLLDRGYEQISMRMFRSSCPLSTDEAVEKVVGPVYCCQEDGMIGLGCGARSYTKALHYSWDYAVGQQGVHEILENYVSMSPEAFAYARHGIELDIEDQKRRFLILSILQCEGLEIELYRNRFGSSPVDDFVELGELEGHGLATIDPDRIRLTRSGVELSDLIGPWLYSERVQSLTESFEWR